ncbi:unnamed protein product [Protopolystoma xenopodis]|uniref:Uncharacterized protein n=1 Tax=Protopolystoma xenopodis TaxID=117903 RepID=A0A3S5BCY2_9PLAT|nr:unnamed protein product [Protopolystoma xenopodis]
MFSAVPTPPSVPLFSPKSSPPGTALAPSGQPPRPDIWVKTRPVPSGRPGARQGCLDFRRSIGFDMGIHPLQGLIISYARVTVRLGSPLSRAVPRAAAWPQLEASRAEVTVFSMSSGELDRVVGASGG